MAVFLDTIHLPIPKPSADSLLAHPMMAGNLRGTPIPVRRLGMRMANGDGDIFQSIFSLDSPRSACTVLYSREIAVLA
jgi:hypothetical protein